jgi:hypothetical protein
VNVSARYNWPTLVDERINPLQFADAIQPVAIKQDSGSIARPVD